MKALVGAFNQEKALVGAFSVIVKTGCGTDGSFYSTNYKSQHPHTEMQTRIQSRGGAGDRYLCRYLHNCVDI